MVVELNRFAMKAQAASIIQFVCLFLVGSGLAQTLIPTGATNSFSIHLQEGFYNRLEVIIQVDGQEVYKGVPSTSPVLGLAKQIPVLTTTEHPTVTFFIPSTRVGWTNRIDLRAGVALGISLETNGLPTVRQAKRFDYD